MQRLVAGAAFVIAPTRWAADTFRRYFPSADVAVIAHGLPSHAQRKHGATQVVIIPDDDVPTVAILGAIGPDKGARRIERLASLAAEREARVRFVVIGYLDRQQDAWQSEDGRLTVHGKYDPRELPVLLDYYRVSLVLFPSAGPETFAFTLSEAWAAGRAVLVPPIGALAERVGDHGAGWVMSEDEWRDESLMLDRILDLLSPYNAVAIENAGARAARMPIATLEDMVGATTAVYERAAATAGGRACSGRSAAHRRGIRLSRVDAAGRAFPRAGGDSARARPCAHCAAFPPDADGTLAVSVDASARGRCAQGKAALVAVSSRYADWLQRGREHQWRRRPVDAMLCFQRAAALEPRAVDPRYLLGEVQWAAGRDTRCGCGVA